MIDLLEKYDKQLSPEELFVVKLLFRNIPLNNLSENNIKIQVLHQFAAKNGLAPLLYWILNKHHHPLADTFKMDFLASSFRNELLKRDANNLIEKMNQNNIKSIPLKGFFIAQTIYDELALRPMSDVDLLIRQEDLPKLSNLLISEQLIRPNELEQRDHSDHHLPCITYGNTPVELHLSLFPTNVKYYIPTKDVWMHETIFHSENNNMPGMNPNQLFIYLSLHIYYTFIRGGVRMSWFYDLLLLANHPKLIPDANEINLWVTKWNVKKPFSLIISILNWLAQDNLPQWTKHYVLEKQSKKISKAITFFSKSDQQKTNYSYQIAWERLLLTNGLRNKLKFIWNHISKDPIHNDKKLSSKQIIKRITLLFWRTIKMIMSKIKNYNPF
ncbi:MAG: nucleotidyltransferase family protein [Marinilabiliaceae bacterium]|nr:nucleotidyltransferase family protein [Marinilabiliaceae bacterium]